MEKLEPTGPAKKERVASVSQRESSWQVPRAAYAIMKMNRAVCSKHQIVRWEKVKMNESRTLARERGSEREHEEERVESTVKEGSFQGGEGRQASRASLGDVE